MHVLFRIVVAAMAWMVMAAPFSINAASVRYSPSLHSANIGTIGTGYEDSYDVALHVDGERFANCSITGVEIPFAHQLDGTEVEIWISSKLELVAGMKVPDKTLASVSVVDGFATCVFPEPVALTADGIYVGYSFMVEDASEDETSEPVLCRQLSDKDGLYLHARKRYTSWTNISDTRGLASAATVIIEGGFNQADMSVRNSEKELNKKHDGSSLEIPVSLTSYGSMEAKKLTFSYSVNGKDYARHDMQLAESMLYGQAYDYVVKIEDTCLLGENIVDVSLEAIDDAININGLKSFSQDVFSYETSPLKRAFIEDYTGLWCNYCARGIAALEYMNRVHQEDFIAVAFHHNDAMTVTDQFPSDVPSYPYAYIDRDWVVDPYYGRFNEGFIENDWETRCNQFTPIDVTVKATMNADGVVTAESDVTSIKKLKNGYRIFYYLVADGLSDPKWIQSNAFGGYDPSMFIIPEMEKFCNSGTRVRGLVYDDVVVMLSDALGIPEDGSDVVDPGVMHHDEYVFDTKECRSFEGVDLISKASTLKVVAGVVDAETGKVLNVARSSVDGFNSVDNIDDERRCVVEYIDLFGRNVSSSDDGIKICQKRYPDGRVLTNKVMSVQRR